jgi:hypothetical protein
MLCGAPYASLVRRKVYGPTAGGARGNYGLSTFTERSARQFDKLVFPPHTFCKPQYYGNRTLAEGNILAYTCSASILLMSVPTPWETWTEN